MLDTSLWSECDAWYRPWCYLSVMLGTDRDVIWMWCLVQTVMWSECDAWYRPWCDLSVMLGTDRDVIWVWCLIQTVMWSDNTLKRGSVKELRADTRLLLTLARIWNFLLGFYFVLFAFVSGMMTLPVVLFLPSVWRLDLWVVGWLLKACN